MNGNKEDANDRRDQGDVFPLQQLLYNQFTEVMKHHPFNQATTKKTIITNTSHGSKKDRLDSDDDLSGIVATARNWVTDKPKLDS